MVRMEALLRAQPEVLRTTVNDSITEALERNALQAGSVTPTFMVDLAEALVRRIASNTAITVNAVAAAAPSLPTAVAADPVPAGQR